MKQNLKNYLIITTTLLIFTFFISLILTILEKNEILTYKTSFIIANSVSYLLLAIFSFILGLKSKKHGFLHGIIFSLIIILLSLVVGNSISDISTIIKVITKSLIILFFTIFGVNKRNS